MSEITPQRPSPEEQLTVAINGLIERAKPGTSELSAMVDFSNLIVAKNFTTLLKESIINLKERDLLVASFQMIRAERVINRTKARINTKRMSNPEYSGTIGLLIDSFNDDNVKNDDPSLNSTRNELLYSVLQHSLRD